MYILHNSGKEDLSNKVFETASDQSVGKKLKINFDEDDTTTLFNSIEKHIYGIKYGEKN